MLRLMNERQWLTDRPDWRLLPLRLFTHASASRPAPLTRRLVRRGEGAEGRGVGNVERSGSRTQSGGRRRLARLCDCFINGGLIEGLSQKGWSNWNGVVSPSSPNAAPPPFPSTPPPPLPRFSLASPGCVSCLISCSHLPLQSPSDSLAHPFFFPSSCPSFNPVRPLALEAPPPPSFHLVISTSPPLSHHLSCVSFSIDSPSSSSSCSLHHYLLMF